MYYLKFIGMVLLGSSLGWSSAVAEEVIDCPNPIFQCVGPGPGGIPPGDPPDPVFKPVSPTAERGIDFNRNIGFIKDGSLTIASGSPETVPELSEYLSRYRDLINPNAVYLLSPNSMGLDEAESDGVLVGGGALTQ